MEVSEGQAECALCQRPFTFVRLPFVRVTPNVCPDCKGEQERQEEEGRAARAREERQAALLDLIAAAGANPAEHRDATLSNFDSGECGSAPVNAALDFVGATKASGRFDPVRGLYLWGPTGSGKTHLAVGILRALLLDLSVNPAEIVYDHAAELIARIQDTYNTKASTVDLLERRFRARLWIVDDLGTERASDDVARHLTLIFTKRALRPTVVTSNLSPEQFERKRPELVRVVSRLGPGYFRTEEVRGRDRRFD